MKKSLVTPVRRLDGITYWVIEDSEAIHDFISNEIRREWEADVRSEGREASEDGWLETLSKRRWSLGVVEIDQIRLNPNIMNYVDDVRGYNFSEELSKRSDELRNAIKEYCTVIWPVIVREEDFMLVDGYCRYAALRTMDIQRVYAYIGTL